MSNFVVLTSSSGTLTVDRAPRIFERYGDRGRWTHVTAGVTGIRFLIESGYGVDDAKFKVQFQVLTLAQAETLAAIIDGGGLITARLKYGASTFVVGYGGEHKIEPLLGEHPDGDRATGAALPAGVTRHTAEVTLYRL